MEGEVGSHWGMAGPSGQSCWPRDNGHAGGELINSRTRRLLRSRNEHPVNSRSLLKAIAAGTADRGDAVLGAAQTAFGWGGEIRPYKVSVARSAMSICSIVESGTVPRSSAKRLESAKLIMRHRA